MTEGLRPLLPIPISAGKLIADSYGYDQVVIIGRRVGDAPEPYGEHVTTYGTTGEHCAVAARIGDHLKHQVMGWPGEIDAETEHRLARMLHEVLEGAAHEGGIGGFDEHRSAAAGQSVVADGRLNLIRAARTLARKLGIVTLPQRRTK